jgi:hypothetical protein
LREILSIPGDRVGKARRIAAAIRETGGYPWVGIHEVSAGGTQVLAWSGPAATRSEIRIPIRGATGGPVVGMLGVASDLPDAFGEEDRLLLEECAALLRPLWGG